MNFISTFIDGLYIIEPKVFGDHRGYFFESFNHNSFKKEGLEYDFVQDNEARSIYGVVRGLHFQLPPYTQAKLVRVFEGEVLDVVVDMRKSSATFGQSFSILLSAENKKQLLIPRGFAHGYAVLSETAVFFYKTDNFYSKEHDSGVKYDDPNFNIDWKVPIMDRILSDKDMQQADFDPSKIVFE